MNRDEVLGIADVLALCIAVLIGENDRRDFLVGKLRCIADHLERDENNARNYGRLEAIGILEGLLDPGSDDGSTKAVLELLP